MEPSVHPIEYFNEWLAEPIALDIHAKPTVRQTMTAIDAHPIARDYETAADRFYSPTKWGRKTHLTRADRYGIWIENQGNHICYVRESDADQTDPPVYFRGEAGLFEEEGFDMVDGDSILVTDSFTRFLWHAFGHHLVLRLDDSGYYRRGVHGVRTRDRITGDYWDPLERRFPTGHNALIGQDTLVIKHWGAAFRTRAARDDFLQRNRVEVSQFWP